MSYLKEAAKWYQAEPHQAAAWDELEAQLPASLIEEFKTAYRDAPLPPAPPATAMDNPGMAFAQQHMQLELSFPSV